MEWLDNIMGYLRRSSRLNEKVLEEATKWIGVHEKRGEDSRGVNAFRKAVDGVADGEPWCAAFVGYCIRAVSLREQKPFKIYLSESCVNMWQKSPNSCKKDKPVKGAVMVWQYPGTVHGHTGVVDHVIDDEYVMTVEGNTRAPNTLAVSGTGVYHKKRRIKGSGDMRVLGFLLPFG